MAAHRWRSRILALIAGALASLLVAEGGLWILHFALRPERRAAELAPKPGERRILCVGDSQTYGVHLDASASYPGRLQSYLDHAPGQPWRVVNLGYPGQNTAQIRARLAQNLAAYRPEIVCLWAGVNDTWSPAMRHLWDSPDGESPPATFESLVQQVRLFKVARMALGRLRSAPVPRRKLTPRAGQGEVPGLDGAQRGEGLGEVESVLPGTKASFSDDELRRHLEIDLARILALCREHGARLVVADYPNRWRPLEEVVNPAIARFARENDLPLVSLHERVRPLLEELGLERTQFKDSHANALGNLDIARCFLETLVAAGLLEPRPEWTDLPSASQVAADLHVAVVGRDASTVRVEVLSQPGWRCDLVVEGPASATAQASLDAGGYALVDIQLPAPMDCSLRIRATASPPPGVDLPQSTRELVAPPPASTSP